MPSWLRKVQRVQGGGHTPHRAAQAVQQSLDGCCPLSLRRRCHPVVDSAAAAAAAGLWRGGRRRHSVRPSCARLRGRLCAPPGTQPGQGRGRAGTGPEQGRALGRAEVGLGPEAGEGPEAGRAPSPVWYPFTGVVLHQHVPWAWSVPVPPASLTPCTGRRCLRWHLPPSRLPPAPGRLQGRGAGGGGGGHTDHTRTLRAHTATQWC